MLDHAKKLEFVHKMAKLGLQHFDAGGTVASGVNTVAQPGLSAVSGVAQPFGSTIQNIGSDLTAKNGFQANAPDISQQEGYYTGANQGQNALEGQLAEQAAGGGPDPAAAALNQATNANANQAAGMVASQRGLNPGEAARIGSQSLVNANQQAAGQAALLKAQQQIAAQQGLENVYGQQENAASQNANVVGGQQLQATGINANVAQNNTNAVNNTTGGLLGGAGQALSSLLAKGGEVKGLKSHVGKWLNGDSDSISMPGRSLMKSGGKVDPKDPKEKATVKGDSYKNDTVPAMLSQGEIVIPRHITQGPKAPEKAAAFVRAVLAKKGLGKSA